MITYYIYDMNSLKISIVTVLFLLACPTAPAQKSICLEIMGAEVSGGTIHISIFNDAQNYKDKVVFLSLKAEAVADTILIDVPLMNGEYLFSLFQDHNENGDLDTNIFGLPQEKVGISNYNGRGIPGNFDRHKISVTEMTEKISLFLYKL